MARLYVKASLSNLPEPERNVEVTIPEISTMEQEVVEQDLDMEEIERRKQELEKKKQEEMARLETQVIQRKFPRPVVFNSIVLVNDLENTFNESQSKYNQLINEEFVNLLAYDSVKHPIPHGRPSDQYKPKEYFDLKLIEVLLKFIKNFINVCRKQGS